jgi:hypothetical protein
MKLEITFNLNQEQKEEDFDYQLLRYDLAVSSMKLASILVDIKTWIEETKYENWDLSHLDENDKSKVTDKTRYEIFKEMHRLSTFIEEQERIRYIHTYLKTWRDSTEMHQKTAERNRPRFVFQQRKNYIC